MTPGNHLEAVVGAAGGPLLPVVLHDVPSAMVLVDLEAGDVVYANRLATAMAGAITLPVPVDAWSTAAGLRTIDGAPLHDSNSPLSRIARGRSVAGAMVRREPAPDGGADRPVDLRGLLWVTGFPVDGTAALRRRALVVFFALSEIGDDRPGDSDDAAALRRLRDRAVVATELSFTITDPTLPTTRWCGSTRPSPA